jgi:signal transduction histidine kinase/ligand-binding sensor domain-containing protein
MRRQLSLCCFLIVVLPGIARAVDPDRRISQYGHTSWKTDDGFVANPIAITQTKDGYLWVATADGLVRFDGVRFTPWVPPNGQSLPHTGLNYLLGGSDGSLWIGTYSGLIRLKDGVLTNFGIDPKGAGISTIIEDHAGAIWVTRYRVRDGKGPLCRVTGKALQCFGQKDGMPARYGLGLAEDSAGNMWVGSNVLCRWMPSSTVLYLQQELKDAKYGVLGVASGDDGTMWATLDGVGPGLGVRHFTNGKWVSYVVPGFNGAKVKSGNLRMDSHHSLWVGTDSDGLYRIHDGLADHYGSANGLSGNAISFVYEDREGNVWVATDRGIDMFRETPVVSYSTDEGLIGSTAQAILSVGGKSIWVTNDGALDIIRDGRVSAVTAGHGLPGQTLEAMFQDSTGRIWMGVDNTIAINTVGRFSEIKNANGRPLRDVGNAEAITEDVDGNIWALVVTNESNECHLLRFKGDRLKQDIKVESPSGWAHFLAADRGAGVWLGFRDGKIVHYRGGFVETVSLLGTKSGTVFSISVDRNGALWAVTSKGLYRWKDGQLSVMDEQNGLPNSYLYSAAQDNSGSLWLYGKYGFMKIPAKDWSAWQEHPRSKVSVRTLDLLDGAQRDTESSDQPLTAKTSDGRLWFVSNSFVQMIDPAHPNMNLVPPPVYIENLSADHKNYEARERVSLPPLKGQLEIDYTALSFSVPKRVLFRYKLQGHDVEWQEAGTRRQAFYNDLRPGNYTFRVLACNSDGIWNEQGATIEFSVAPKWFQTAWFIGGCVLVGGLLAWLLYSIRVRQIARQITSRFDERLSERTRIARDLHDTFLQTIQGSKFVADDALDHASDPAHMRDTMEQLSLFLGRATEEGRAALNSLRTSTTETNDLAAAFQRAMDECRMQNLMETSFSVTGEPKEMHPIVRDEVYRIGYEAIRNACIHSHASKLLLELQYSQDLTMRINDDGRGIDPTVLKEGKVGHFGVQGMKERAARIMAKIAITSSSRLGTQVLLVVPGSIIYRTVTPAARSSRMKLRSVLSRMGLPSNTKDI